jgi:hypothetical protein
MGYDGGSGLDVRPVAQPEEHTGRPIATAGIPDAAANIVVEEAVVAGASQFAGPRRGRVGRMAQLGQNGRKGE